MPNLIFKIKNYKNEGVVESIVNYVMTSVYIESYGARGCFLLPGENVAECVRNAFQAVKNVYYKTDGQLVQHIIVGFGDMNISETAVCAVAGAIADYYFVRGYQVFWGSHFGSDGNDSYRHIHVVLNTVNAMTGEVFWPTYDNMGALKKFLVNLFPEVSWRYVMSESFYYET